MDLLRIGLFRPISSKDTIQTPDQCRCVRRLFYRQAGAERSGERGKRSRGLPMSTPPQHTSHPREPHSQKSYHVRREPVGGHPGTGSTGSEDPCCAKLTPEGSISQGNSVFLLDRARPVFFGKTFWGPRRDPAKRSLWGAEEQGSGRSFRRRRKRRQADFATTPWGGAFRAAKRHTLVPPPWGGNLRVCAVRGHSIAPAGRIPAPWTETLVPVSGRPSAPLGISPCPRAGARPSLSATQGAAPAGQTPLIPYESSAFISSISRS